MFPSVSERLKIEIEQVELLIRGEKGFIESVVISSIVCSI